MTYASNSYWNEYFAALGDQGGDLDWSGRWTEPFIPVLRDAKVQTVLELGCGTGNDAARLADAGFQVVGVDYSTKAIEQARSKSGGVVAFQVVDIAQRLPFDDGAFDAVMANVSLHMFDAATTASIFGEIRRILAPQGVFVFHVNSEGDRPLREARRPVEREIEPGYILEAIGQTVRFFSRTDLERLLSGWSSVDLEHVEIADRDSGTPFKRVWRGIAIR